MTNPYDVLRKKIENAKECFPDPMGNHHYLMECGYLAYCPNGRPEVCPRCRKPTSSKPLDE